MTTRTRRFELAFVVAGALALAAGCEEPVPGQPTYTANIRPLFEAHCTRCHSADGPDGGTGLDPRALNGYATDNPPSHLDVYASSGDCNTDGAANVVPCVPGAMFSATGGLKGTLYFYVHGTGASRMPPAPAEGLDGWELSLIDRWLANGYPE
jgi:hypothetical protein